jgi:hypothetical protein
MELQENNGCGGFRTNICAFRVKIRIIKEFILVKGEGKIRDLKRPLRSLRLGFD